MDYLPIFCRLDNKPVLLVGGGEVAGRKARLLLGAGGRVTPGSPPPRPPSWRNWLPTAASSGWPVNSRRSNWRASGWWWPPPIGAR